MMEFLVWVKTDPKHTRHVSAFTGQVASSCSRYILLLAIRCHYKIKTTTSQWQELQFIFCTHTNFTYAGNTSFNYHKISVTHYLLVFTEYSISV